MAIANIVWCDFGFLPGYLTLALYIIAFILVHLFIIKPILRNKEKVSKTISKRIRFFKGKEKIIEALMPVLIVAIMLFMMFFLYPVITNSRCTHLFWRIFGIETL